MAQCPTCGSEVAEGAAFCPDCGTDLKAASTPPAGAPAATPGTPPTAPATAPGVSPPAAPAAAAPAGSGGDTSATPDVPSAPPPPSAPAPSATPATAGARLTLKRGGALTAEVFPVGGRVVVGRFDVESGPVDVDLGPLPEANYVSRHHAEVWSGEGGQWFVKDLGSRNGTFVRPAGQTEFRKAAGEQAIGDGDEIALGNARFEFRTG